MCGLICALNTKLPRGRVEHRGPDDPHREQSNNMVAMRFSRLAINGSTRGIQPFVHENHMMVCNGEIYNYKELSPNGETSDCKALFDSLRINNPYNVCKGIANSEFAFCYWNGYELWAARDPVGVRPLFFTRTPCGGIIFASEMKVLAPHKVCIFPPGHIYCSATDSFVSWMPLFWSPHQSLEWETPMNNIKNNLIKAVVDRTDMSDRPVAFLLSGGLDSSIIASIACLHSTCNYMYTFTIGKPDSPAVLAAAQVAKFLEQKCISVGKNYKHTHIDFDFDLGFNLIPKVIYDVESWDITTIRASVPMWILCLYIKQNTPCKVILSGEGADELLAGYKCFGEVSTASELFYETMRMVQKIHQYDVLKADRCTACHGLELRVPFLDKRVVDACMYVHPLHKMITSDKIEKTILRDAFKGYLPNDILWRPKEEMGDDWNSFVESKFDKFTPQTNEETFYNKMFHTYFDLKFSEHL